MIKFSNENPPASQQALFDAIVLNMKEQGKPSYDSHAYVCLYRSNDGCGCAIGSVMRDEDYDKTMETYRVAKMIDCYNSVAWMQPYLVLLSLMQRAHDNPAMDYYGEDTTFLSCFLTNATTIAKSYNLDATVCLEGEKT